MITINIAGQEYPAQMDLNALCELEAITGQTAGEIFESFGDGNYSFKVMRSVLAACINSGIISTPNCKLDMVGPEFVGQVGFQEMQEAMGELMGPLLVEDEGEKKAVAKPKRKP